MEAYGLDDFVTLAADESRRDVFMAAYRHSIVPRMCAAADIWMGQRHLLDYPSPTYLDGLFAASGIDWTKFLADSVVVAASRYAQHADAWLPIMSMWEGEEFSTMFPAAPYFFSPVAVALQAMIGVTWQREQELLGVSSGSHMVMMMTMDLFCLSKRTPLLNGLGFSGTSY
jgi:hypothetical protein